MEKYEGQTVENVINMIKQKHFSDLTAEDYSFLKAREEYLSEADKAIYLNGERPEDVIVDSTPLTREERIINENRPLQDTEHEVREAQAEAARVLKEAALPKSPEGKSEADEARDEAREEKFASLEKEVKALEKSEKDEEVKAKAKK